MKVDSRRVRQLNQARQGNGPVLYWMSRDQRVRDNWALIHALDLSHAGDVPLWVVFCLVSGYAGAGLRQYHFMLHGLKETVDELQALNIPFFLLTDNPGRAISRFARRHKAGALVMDFDPLRMKRKWQAEAVSGLDCPAFLVDAHNVVPCWAVSDKREYAARTIRPKLHARMADFLTPFPHIKPQKSSRAGDGLDVGQALAACRPDAQVHPVKRPHFGTAAGYERVRELADGGLAGYAQKRNDPNARAQSGLSPYLHFGQISPQETARQIMESKYLAPEDKDDFLEELIVRRELSDNFCLHTPDYDSLPGLPQWGQKTLEKHRADSRPYSYSQAEFDGAATHDELWNAAQRQLKRTGIMHGYLRMYWAKKILEWMPTPEEAVAVAVHLNDRYGLDGRDPNGYVGILWSVGGLHDRPWKERSIFGTVRFMSRAGCRRKFDVDRFIADFSE